MNRPARPHDPGAAGGTPRPAKAKGAWYGTDLDFQGALLRDIDAHDEHAGLITSALAGPKRRHSWDRVWTFTHAGLSVPGRLDPVTVSVEFHEQPNYAIFGLDAWDFPLVFADPGAVSKHRHHGIDALCLWFPGDPENRRWHHTDGLIALFNLARNHLFYEDYWRETGGYGVDGQAEGHWPGDEAPHGYLEALAEVS